MNSRGREQQDGQNCVGGKGDAYNRVLFGKPEGNDHLEDVCRWEYSIKAVILNLDCEVCNVSHNVPVKLN